MKWTIMVAVLMWCIVSIGCLISLAILEKRLEDKIVLLKAEFNNSKAMKYQFLANFVWFVGLLIAALVLTTLRDGVTVFYGTGKGEVYEVVSYEKQPSDFTGYEDGDFIKGQDNNLYKVFHLNKGATTDIKQGYYKSIEVKLKFKPISVLGALLAYSSTHATYNYEYIYIKEPNTKTLIPNN